MKVGLTGGQGFIGKWVTDELLRRGHTVLVLDHKKRPAEQFSDNDNVDYLWGDVRDEVVMMELAAHVDGIIHLAAVLGTQETIGDPRPAATTNLVGGLNFLHAIKHYDLPGVYICVGNHWMNNPYSISKTTVERFCHMYRKEHGTRINQVRAVNAYGPLQLAAPPYGPGKVRKITPAFVCRALNNDPIEVYGDGQQISDMVHVRDLAHTLVDAFDHAADNRIHEHVIECGPDEPATVLEIAQTVRDLTAERTGNTVDIVHLPMRPGEIPGDVVRADTTTMERADMRKPQIALEDGLRETIAWFADPTRLIVEVDGWRHRV